VDLAIEKRAGQDVEGVGQRGSNRLARCQCGKLNHCSGATSHEQLRAIWVAIIGDDPKAAGEQNLGKCPTHPTDADDPHRLNL
jgi:hypothetical protein